MFLKQKITISTEIMLKYIISLNYKIKHKSYLVNEEKSK